MITYDNFSELFQGLARLINEEGVESQPRDMKVKEVLGVEFKLTNPKHRLLYIDERDASLSYTIAEAVWYFLGNNETSWISNYSNFWSKISDDGTTANSAYGARIFIPNQALESSESLVQWDYIIDELKNDRDSRRAVIHIRTPHDSINAKLDVPCTLDMQFFIRENKLHMIVHMRSSDLILGITYDIPAFTLMQEAMLLSLREHYPELELGDYIHMSNSLHVYERHYEMLDEICEADIDVGPAMPDMPTFKMRTFKALDDVQRLARLSKNVEALAEIDHKHITPDYWKDWSSILIMHRLDKLIRFFLKKNDLDSSAKFANARKKLLATLSFDGYKRFIR